MNKNIVCTLLMGVTVTGCGFSNILKIGSKHKMPQESSAKRITSAPKVNISSSLMIVDRKAQMSQDGQINVTAKILNKSGQAIPVNIQTSFRDAQGQVIDRTEYTEATIPGNAYYYYFASTANGQARTFEIIMKPAVKF